MNAYVIVSHQGNSLPEAYRNMVFSKWLRSLRYGNDYFKLIDKDAYFNAYHRFIQHLLERRGIWVNLAVLADDKDVCLGFCVYRIEGPIGQVWHTLDYVHVHKDHRKSGIGRALIPHNVKAITHVTKIGLSIWGAQMPGVVFNPFA